MVRDRPILAVASSVRVVGTLGLGRLVLWCAVSFLGAREAAAALQGVAQTDDAADQQVANRVCGGCHTPESVKGTRRSRSQWEETIEKMVERGAKMTDPEYEVVMRYLLSQAGRVNVNAAPASDLVAVLRISSDDANRITAHREKHGRFADFDRLLEVRDIDAARLKETRVAIEF